LRGLVQKKREGPVSKSRGGGTGGWVGEGGKKMKESEGSVGQLGNSN